MKEDNNMHPLAKASKEYESLFDGWFKSLLGISTGALAVLVSLMPETPPPSPDKYALAVCWVSLAVCIICSLIATFRPIILAKLNLQVQEHLLNNPPDKLKIEQNKKFLNPRRQMLTAIFCQKLAIITFCIAFISLAIYGYLRTM